MPLTLSHPAAVLPLRALGLPVTALVAGSMVPDVPLFLGWTRGYEVTHGLLGVVTVDPILATLALVVWFGVIRDALVDLSPDAIRSRLAAHIQLTSRQWLLVPAAAALGALTHVLWDSFTHPGRWGVQSIAWLQTEHGPLPGYKWAQYVSGVVGLVIVGRAIYVHLRSLPRIHTPARRSRGASLVVPAIAAISALAGVATAVGHAPGLHAMAFNGVVNAIIAAVVSTAAVCVGWRALSWRAAR